MASIRRYRKPSQLFKRPGARVWHFYFRTYDGRRLVRSTGQEKKADAARVMRAFLKERGLDQDRDLSELSFRDYAAPYFTEDCPRTLRRRAEGKAMGKVHVAKSRRWLEQVLELVPEFAEKPIARIRRGDLLDLRARLHQLLPERVNTVNKLIATVKTVLSEAAFRDEIASDPGAKVGILEYSQRQRGVLDVSEVREILEKKPGAMATDPLVDLAVTLLFATGCRVGEARALRWSAMDLSTGRCMIREAFKSDHELGPPKWGKIREIVLPKLLLSRLEAWRDRHPPEDPDRFVLSEGGGPPVGVTWLRNAFARVLAAAEASDELAFERGDRWLTPHACRHTLNTSLLAAEVSPLLVQTFLGWSSAEARALTNVQRQYSHLELLRLEDVAAKIDELYGPPEAKPQLQHA